jgi:hypothetical protein
MITKTAYRLIPILLFVGGNLYSGIFEGGVYIFYARFISLLSNDITIYIVIGGFVCLYPLCLETRFNYESVRFIFMVLCFYLIQEILYHACFLVLITNDEIFNSRVGYIPYSILYFFLVQMLLRLSKITTCNIFRGNLIVLMCVWASLLRDMNLLTNNPYSNT